MKIQVAGLKRDELISHIKKYHPKLQITTGKPEFIICYGGDGTLLYAEQHWPQIPKVMIRHSQVCAKCSDLTRDQILLHLEKGEYYIKEQILLEAKVRKETVTGLNDIFIGHELVNTALRFKVCLNNILYGGEVFGDGLVIATPLGSTGYYQSITRSNFESGLGIAFNNAVNIISHLVVNVETIIKVQITRGPGIITHDNSKDFVKIDTGDEIAVQRSNKYARLVVLEGRGKRFNVGISQNRVPLSYCQICHKQILNGT